MPESPQWITELFKYGGVATFVFLLSWVYNKSQDKKWEAIFAQQKIDAETEQKRWDALFAERKEEAEAERKSRKREQDIWTEVRNREFQLLNSTIDIVSKHTDSVKELTSHIKTGGACKLSEYSKGKAA